MSLTSAPNFNDYINRLVLILSNSPLLFPNTIGLNVDATDLISNVHTQEPPTPENVVGTELPYIFVRKSTNPILRKVPAGRDSRDEKGPERYTLEFYIVVVAKGREFEEAQQILNDVTAAALTTLGQNKRLTDKVGANPLAADAEFIVVPYLLESSARTLMAQNIICRADVFVNLRIS